MGVERVARGGVGGTKSEEDDDGTTGTERRWTRCGTSVAAQKRIQVRRWQWSRWCSRDSFVAGSRSDALLLLHILGRKFLGYVVYLCQRVCVCPECHQCRCQCHAPATPFVLYPDHQQQQIPLFYLISEIKFC